MGRHQAADGEDTVPILGTPGGHLKCAAVHPIRGTRCTRSPGHLSWDHTDVFGGIWVFGSSQSKRRTTWS